MTLRSARIQRGLSIEQVAQDTRISARFLEALEDEAFQELPAPVYVRGFLRSYGNSGHEIWNVTDPSAFTRTEMPYATAVNTPVVKPVTSTVVESPVR